MKMKTYNPSFDGIMPDKNKAVHNLIIAKKNCKPKKYVYKLDNGSFVESDKKLQTIKSLYKQEAVLVRENKKSIN